ncbi:MAG: hypothetical protein JO110_16685 [Acetobacteraceae bacterium]|nr:hypothetical protein [Acetobacteraceae bacterium]
MAKTAMLSGQPVLTTQDGKDTTMKKLSAAALAIALLGATAPAFAQSDTPSAASSAVGGWLYDVNGTLLGSVYSLKDNGHTAIVQIGSYRTPGRHLVAVPSSDIVISGGHAVLTGSSAANLSQLPTLG